MVCPYTLLCLYLFGAFQLVSGFRQAFQQLTVVSASCGSMQQTRSALLRVGCVATRPEEAVAPVATPPPIDTAASILDKTAAVDKAAIMPSKKKVGKAEKAQKGRGQAIIHGTPLVIGLSHKTATVEVREKLSIPERSWNEASAGLCEFEAVQEAAVLSTCNRFEVYIVARDHFAATRDVLSYLQNRSGLTDAVLRPNLFMLQNEDAVAHLLRVSAGLDSLVVGEGQILSQVKACYSHAIAPESEDEPAGSAAKVLGRLLNSAVMAGKFVRTETDIAKGAVSISSAAVELAVLKCPEDLSKPLSEARVVVVGAGKMSKLLFTHLASHGVTRIHLLNRGRERAEELAAQYPDLEVKIDLMDELWPALEQADLAFTSTSATGCILTKALLQEHVWGQTAQPLSVIDISVPRNVESECNDVDGVRAYNVDDLKHVVARNQAKRRKSVLEAEVLLRAELAKYTAWQESLKFVPAISRLQSKFEEVRAAELNKAMKKLKNLSDKDRQAVEVVTKGIINKLLHAPMSYLRSDDTDGNKASVQQIEEVFGLDRDRPSR